MPGVFALGQAALGQLPGNLPAPFPMTKGLVLVGISIDTNDTRHFWYMNPDGTQGPIIPPYGHQEF
jgi:hypothetical protein